jgi:pyruvate dehydrogenase E2 component (dihydrolipoamide acetyltransferase)
MPYEFKFPDVGEGITEGEIKKWRIKEGDDVKEHDVLAEVETDKAVAEIPSPVSGKVLKIHFKEGDTVKVDQVMVTLSGGPATDEKPAKKPKIAEKAAIVGELPEAEETGILATPAVRRLAKERGVDLSKVKGTGPGGRILENDLLSTSSGAEKTPEIKIKRKYDFYGPLERVPLKGIRKAVAKKMAESWANAVQVTAMDDADVNELFELRNKEKVEAKKKGIKLTFLPYIIKAVVAALKEYPYVNSSLEEDEIILKKYYNIGVAVATVEGLMVPVVKIADSKDLYQLAKEVEDLAEKANSRKIDLTDLQGGTFTITNYGSIGGMYGTPAINYPEAAILGLGKIEQKPVVRDGKVVARYILPLSLTFDHRIFDGAIAGLFLNKVRELLANPQKLK